MSNITSKSWFLPLVFTLALTDLTIGLAIGLKIGYEKGRQEAAQIK